MSLVDIIIAIAILGLIIWIVTTYLPIDARLKNLIIIIACIFVAVWFLQEMGWIGSLRGGANQVTIR